MAIKALWKLADNLEPWILHDDHVIRGAMKAQMQHGLVLQADNKVVIAITTIIICGNFLRQCLSTVGIFPGSFFPLLLTIILNSVLSLQAHVPGREEPGARGRRAPQVHAAEEPVPVQDALPRPRRVERHACDWLWPVQ